MKLQLKETESYESAGVGREVRRDGKMERRGRSIWGFYTLEFVAEGLYTALEKCCKSLK